MSVPLTSLPTATAITGSELVLVVQNGTAKVTNASSFPIGSGTIVSQAVGWTATSGTTPKTLTVNTDFTTANALVSGGALGTPSSGTLTSCSITQRNIGNSTNLDTALLNLDDSTASHEDTGWQSFGGAGNYYSIAANQLTLLRPGVGFINGKKITWTAPQTAAAFTTYAAHWIYINSSGVIGITTNRTHALYKNNILLFEVYYDATNYEVVWENHTVAMDTDLQEYVHESIGTVLTPIEGTNIIGADMTRVATGTGGAAGDRQIKIVGTADINDAGVITNIPDSAGAAISWSFYYTDGSGRWVEYGTGTQFPMFYNAAGTMTAIGTSGATDHAIWTCYAVKGEPNSGLPIYVAVADTTRYATSAACQTAITSGLNAQVSGTLFNALEPAQLGQVILFNNGSGGYIEDVMISKSTARSVSAVGGTSIASGITTNTVGFDGLLSAADSNVQLALETINATGKTGVAIASAATVDLSTSTGKYIHITGSVTITSFGTVTTGALFHLVFDAAPLVTHNGTSLILPGAANIQTAAGDTMIMRSEGGGNWRCINYQPNQVMATLSAAQTFVTGIKKFTNSLIALIGSSTGYTIFTSDNASATNYTLHVPAADDTLVCAAATQTLTNKRNTKRVVGYTANGAAPSINTDITDTFAITGQTVAITGIVTTGTPVAGDELFVDITSTNTGIAFNAANFESSGTITLPTAVTSGVMKSCGFRWNPATSKWRIMGIS